MISDKAVAECVESDLIICRPKEWKECPENHDRQWASIRVGRRILALKIVGVMSYF
jgi:hypothetical protein